MHVTIYIYIGRFSVHISMCPPSGKDGVSILSTVTRCPVMALREVTCCSTSPLYCSHMGGGGGGISGGGGGILESGLEFSSSTSSCVFSRSVPDFDE